MGSELRRSIPNCEGSGPLTYVVLQCGGCGARNVEGDRPIRPVHTEACRNNGVPEEDWPEWPREAPLLMNLAS